MKKIILVSFFGLVSQVCACGADPNQSLSAQECLDEGGVLHPNNGAGAEECKDGEQIGILQGTEFGYCCES